MPADMENLTEIIALVTAILALVTAVLTYVKVQTVHVLVNSQFSTALKRIAQLSRALESSDTRIPKVEEDTVEDDG